MKLDIDKAMEAKRAVINAVTDAWTKEQRDHLRYAAAIIENAMSEAEGKEGA